MKKTNFTIVLALIVLSACTKYKEHNQSPGPAHDDPIAGYLVRSISWNNGTKAVISYNADSSFKEMAFAFENSVGSNIYTWENGKLKEMYDDRSPYKDIFYYNGNRINHYVHTGYDGDQYKIEYQYNTNGTLHLLKYYIVRNGVSELASGSTYEYNQEGYPTKITTDGSNYTLVTSIEAYSDSINFSPLLFVSSSLMENYIIFNIPVLSRLNKYPTKIVRKIKTGGNPFVTEKIEENICELSGKRLDKIATSYIFPDHPEYNTSRSTTFHYQ